MTRLLGLGLIDSYAWRLEAAIWVKTKKDDDEVRCRPRLALVHRGWNHGRSPQDYDTLGYIEYGKDELLKSSSRWMVYYYPRQSSELWAEYDETKYSRREILKDGEKREPRDSADEALKRLLQLTAEDIPRLEHSVLAKLSSEYVPVLRKLTDMHVRRQQQQPGPSRALEAVKE